MTEIWIARQIAIYISVVVTNWYMVVKPQMTFGYPKARLVGILTVKAGGRV